MQGRSVPSIPVRPHDYLNILIERDEEAHKALNRKLPEFAPQHLGDIGLFDPEKMLFGIRHTDILEDIPVPGLVSLLPHGSLSFAIR
jgi:hypothetical protein